MVEVGLSGWSWGTGRKECGRIVFGEHGGESRTAVEVRPVLWGNVVKGAGCSGALMSGAG